MWCGFENTKHKNLILLILVIKTEIITLYINYLTLIFDPYVERGK